MLKKCIIILLVSLNICDSDNFSDDTIKGFRKGPYIIYTGNKNEMAILWQQERSDSSRITWGREKDKQNNYVNFKEVEDTSAGRQFIYNIPNLSPGKRIHYKVFGENNVDSGYFITAPVKEADSLTFFAYGDTRSNPRDHDNVARGILKEIEDDPSNQTFLLHCGDWTSTSTEENWQKEFFNKDYKNISKLLSMIPIQGCRGNHERNAVNYKKYWPYPFVSSGAYYSFNYGPVHVSVVDQYTDYSPGSVQLEWLENDLAETTKIWKFILLHAPGYTDEGGHDNNEDTQFRIHPLCIQYNVKVVFAGHNHYYAHCLVDGVHHLTLGGGGAPIYQVLGEGEGLIKSESSHHYAKLYVKSGHLVINVKRPDGSVIEEINIALENDDLYIDKNQDKIYSGK